MRFNKSLGQHFLKDKQIAQTIANYCLERNPTLVFEVGSGAGALTRPLLESRQFQADQYCAVECDAEKIAYLRQTFPAFSPCFVHGDVLEMQRPFGERSFCVVGNFPYYICSSIVLKILSWAAHVRFAVGMFQTEMAERLLMETGAKSRSLLGVAAQTQFRIRRLLDLPAEVFIPPPKVNSTVLLFENLGDPYRVLPDFEAFFLFVKRAFSGRRKILKNNIGHLFMRGHPHEMSLRADQLSVDDFVRLFLSVHPS